MIPAVLVVREITAAPWRLLGRPALVLTHLHLNLEDGFMQLLQFHDQPHLVLVADC